MGALRFADGVAAAHGRRVAGWKRSFKTGRAFPKRFANFGNEGRGFGPDRLRQVFNDTDAGVLWLIVGPACMETELRLCVAGTNIPR